MRQPENQTKSYDVLFADIDSGRIKIPDFQRDLVWKKEQTAYLIDSLIKGYPIGTFIFWKTRVELRYLRNIGNVPLPETPKGDLVQYVLDGQQRITSLYAVRKGARATKDGAEIDYKDISINLDLDPDGGDELVTVMPPSDGATSISVYDLLNFHSFDLADRYPSRDHRARIEAYQRCLSTYSFATVLISDYPIDVACDVFTRINTGGTELTLFEIMVARTFQEASGEAPRFDLAREYRWLIENDGSEKDLQDAKFDTIPSSTVLQCVVAHVTGQMRRQDMLRMDRQVFIDAWPTVRDGIFAAVDYIRLGLCIPVSRLLPYNTLLVPLTYFFIRRGRQPTTPFQEKLLAQYFWWASLRERFSSGVEGRVVQDLKRMDAILEEGPPDYPPEELRLTLDDLRWHWFSAGDAFSKAVVCLYAQFGPRTFDRNRQVNLDNSWLRAANSMNYHHFFPRSYLRMRGVQEARANSVLNITLVDDYVQKYKIRAKAPSQYMRTFKHANHHLAETMCSHLIDDVDGYGIWEDDYPRFIERRGERVLAELNQRLQPQLD